MPLVNTGRYAARIAENHDDLRSAQALRALAFTGADRNPLDRDRFDDICTHVLVTEASTGHLVCCFRVLLMPSGSGMIQSYSAQFYDLSALERYAGAVMELGRFCVLPGLNDPDVLRVAWGALTSYVDENKVKMLFGCTSFAGTNPLRYCDAFALLRESYLAPERWRPGVKAPEIFDFARDLKGYVPDRTKAAACMPPLLRTYLQMGGWVSDHAVVDTEMNTLHVFTGLEIRSIPPARQRRLRAISHSLDDGAVAG